VPVAEQSLADTVAADVISIKIAGLSMVYALIYVDLSRGQQMC